MSLIKALIFLAGCPFQKLPKDVDYAALQLPSPKRLCSSPLIRVTNLKSSNLNRTPVFILKTQYPSGRTWASICSLSGYACCFSIKTGTRHIMRPDELSFEMRLERRAKRDSSSRRIIRLVPAFILKTHNPTSYKCLPKSVRTDNASY